MERNQEVLVNWELQRYNLMDAKPRQYRSPDVTTAFEDRRGGGSLEG